MLYRTAPKFAWNTHYVGHLRGVNNEIIDAYQLKTLDAVLALLQVIGTVCEGGSSGSQM